MKAALKKIFPEIILKNGKPSAVILNIDDYQEMLEQLGLPKKPRAATYHDLDKLAGTWSDNDYLEFKRKVADFEKVDEGMWR